MFSTRRWHSPFCIPLWRVDSCPPDDDNLLRALCKKPACPDFTGAGMYGTSPVGFTACGKMAFFGALGPVGTGGSGIAGGAEIGALPFWT